MERREAVRYITLLLGGAVVGGSNFITGCKSSTGKPMEWDASEIAYLDEIAETILPQTKTAGAKAAKVGDYMKVMVNDCYEAGDQQAFRKGMNTLNEESTKKFGKDFMNITPEQRKELLIVLDKEAKEFQEGVNKFNKEEDQKAKNDPKYTKQTKSPHYFFMLKQLTLMGYFTSEVGAKEGLGYVAVPGRYDACVPYEKGKRWS
jgi:hypothetical protein